MHDFVFIVRRWQRRRGSLIPHLQYRTRPILELLNVIAPPMSLHTALTGDDRTEGESSIEEKPGAGGSGTRDIQQELLEEVRMMRVSHVMYA